MKDIFNYIHKNNNIEKKQMDIFIKQAPKIEEEIKQALKRKPIVEDYTSNQLDMADEVEHKIRQLLMNEKIKINPDVDKNLYDGAKKMGDLIQKYIPSHPGYIDDNSISLNFVADVRDFERLNTGINPYDFAEDYFPGTDYSTTELGEGFILTTFGSIYYGGKRVFSPKRFADMMVSMLDLSKKILEIKIKKENELLSETGLYENGLSIRFPLSVLGLDEEALNDALSDDDNGETPMDNVTAEDLINGFGDPEVSDDQRAEWIKNFLGNKIYLNGQVITEEDSAKNKDYLQLLWLLFLGGGSVGVAPLPSVNDKCSKALKPERTGGLNILKRKGAPSDGQCDQAYFDTYHKKMWSKDNPSGTKTSFIQILYKWFDSLKIFDLNINRSYIWIGFRIKVSKWHVGFGTDFTTVHDGLSIGGALERVFYKIQEKISSEINSFFAVRKYLKLPTLAEDGCGFNFSGYERLDGSETAIAGLSNFERVQVALYSRINFSRIFEFVILEKLYTANVSADKETESVLENVIKIYNSPTYKLVNVSKYLPLDSTKVHEYYKKGYHYIYGGENLSSDKFELTISGESSNKSAAYSDNEKNKIMSNPIKTIIENNLSELQECSDKILDLELFDGNNFTKKNIVYKYNSF